MSRLLHAAARGARIQTLAGTLGWRDTDLFGPWSYDDGDRIHPDDEHLQYGPISTALREFAQNGKEPYTLSGLMAIYAFNYEREYRFVTKADWPHAQMFALFLAEALADEGM